MTCHDFFFHVHLFFTSFNHFFLFNMRHKHLNKQKAYFPSCASFDYMHVKGQSHTYILVFFFAFQNLKVGKNMLALLPGYFFYPLLEGWKTLWTLKLNNYSLLAWKVGSMQHFWKIYLTYPDWCKKMGIKVYRNNPVFAFHFPC